MVGVGSKGGVLKTGNKRGARFSVVMVGVGSNVLKTGNKRGALNASIIAVNKKKPPSTNIHNDISETSHH